MRHLLAVLTASLLAACASSPAPALEPDAPHFEQATPAPRFEPLTAAVNLTDAYRFVDVFRAADGKPSAEALQTGYLDGAGRGIEIFTPGRIESAEILANAVAKRSENYTRAIEVCLPIVEKSNAELRAIYLALSSLFPGRELPEIYAVFGAYNSGGTAQADAQVIGIEVVCDISPDADAVRRTLRTFYSHETVHSLQPDQDRDVLASDVLLVASLGEGMADFVSYLVTGVQPSPDRDAWAKPREADLWKEFLKDRARLQELIKVADDLSGDSPEVNELFGHWHSNFNAAPDGWPYEMGYWIGQQICQAYFDQAEDKRQAIADLMALSDPTEILRKSGYDPA